MKRSKGFSLIELLIVIAIVLVIAGIAIPQLLRARIAANESAAAATVRTLATAQIQYQTSYPQVGYAAALSNLGGACSTASPPDSSSACLIDNVIVNASTGGTPKGGYFYGGTGTLLSFSLGAYPFSTSRTGRNSYCAFEDNVVRYDPTGTANIVNNCSSTVSPLQN